MQTALKISLEHPEIAEFFRAQGAAAERARIQAIEAQLIPGHEAMINRLKYDGNSTAGDAAQAILAAEYITRFAGQQHCPGDAVQPVLAVNKLTNSDQTEALASDAPPFLPWFHL
ncbi:hypothetical protein [Candidatus Nitrotoga arctica]|uniref:Uncharacterized protein n=1 Tax=Candidatus Nitrotoga arctica TaxID=453162 RepID=A0ABN8AP13_9PROT|nr:hypothetical protein [Candidatus Nitrotoga arctica]CAG9932433.1 protein of unknown function [Candidatus Nitrotoga arctica]